MKVGVISDTHDRLPTFRRALAMFSQLKVAAIFHAGDYVAPFAAKLIAPDARGMTDLPVHCIYGNNDGERAGLKKVLPQIVDGPLRVTLQTPHGPRVLAMHHFIDWFEPDHLKGADIVISGHNHEASVEQRDGQMLLNPGECCGWVNDRCTVSILDLSQPQPEARIVEVHA
jgi:putative phosphoesterase